MQGIYKIANKLNNDCYVGQSIDIKKRWREHKFRKIIRGIPSDNYHLYRAFRKYGIENFEFTILESVLDRNNLFEREVYWYKKLKPIYNQEYPSTIFYNEKGKRVYQISKDKLKIVDIFFNSQDAQRKTKINSSNIRKCCSRKTISAGGYYWCFEKDYSIDWKPVEEKPHIICKGQEEKSVAQIDLKTGEVIKIFKSAKIASKETKAQRSKISNVCNGKRKTSAGYRWKFV